MLTLRVGYFARQVDGTMEMRLAQVVGRDPTAHFVGTSFREVSWYFEERDLGLVIAIFQHLMMDPAIDKTRVQISLMGGGIDPMSVV